MRKVRDFDTIVTASEKEALILENNLIKQYRPKYNIRLKDDKSYLSAKITNHAWPRITVTRKIVKDGGRYFGPFGSADGLRETIDVIRKVFPLRTCTDTVFRNRSRPCLEYQIKRCLGPCCLPVDRDEYGRHLHAAQMLLEGKNLELLREMRDLMKDHASRLEFEEAARIRDRVRAIEKTVERQTVLHHWGIDQDVFGIYREGGYIEAIVLIVRSGQADQHAGMELSGPRILDRRSTLRPDRAVLLGRADCARRSDPAGRTGRRRGARGTALRAARQEMRSACAAARREAAPARDGDGKRAAKLRLPARQRKDARADARGTARQAASAQLAQADGMLRHFEPAGLDGGRIAGHVRRRRAAKESLSPLSHPKFRGPGRFRQHVRSPEAAPRARGARKHVPRSVGDRRRQGPAQRRARSAPRVQTAAIRSIACRWPSSTSSTTGAKSR